MIKQLPKNLDEAVQHVIDATSEQDRKNIINGDCQPYQLHHTVGRFMRNEWGLWSQESDLCHWFRSRGIQHPDDMTGIIFESVFRELRREDVDIEGQITSYRNYWLGQGIDPDNLIAPMETKS